MDDLEYKIRINSSLIKNRVQNISTLNAQINYHYELFNKKLAEIKIQLKAYEVDKERLVLDLKEYFKYEEEKNLPANLTFKRLYNNLTRD